MEGGALPTEVRAPKVKAYVDTPMKKAVREIHRDWQPLWKHQETPPFAEMRHAAQNYDNTTFEKAARVYPRPEHPPTGRGALHDDRETSHYVGKVLERIHPSLARVYRGGATNPDHHLMATNMYTKGHIRDGEHGGLREINHVFGRSASQPHAFSRRAPSHYRPIEKNRRV